MKIELSRSLRIGIILLTSSVVLIGLLLRPAIPQDPMYHQFADQRTLLGVSNLLNVMSNLGFLIVGILGVLRARRIKTDILLSAFWSFCIAVGLVSIGSAYYHLQPTHARLVWDRLPMTVGFMSLFAMVLADRVSLRCGRAAWIPLVLFGLFSVAYWYFTELNQQGDLRLYILVQFLPLVLIPILLLAYPGHKLPTWCVWASLVTYALAKAAEHWDMEIYLMTGGLSGHTLKHMLAALAVYWIVVAIPTKAGAND